MGTSIVWTGGLPCSPSLYSTAYTLMQHKRHGFKQLKRSAARQPRNQKPKGDATHTQSCEIKLEKETRRNTVTHLTTLTHPISSTETLTTASSSKRFPTKLGHMITDHCVPFRCFLHHSFSSLQVFFGGHVPPILHCFCILPLPTTEKVSLYMALYYQIQLLPPWALLAFRPICSFKPCSKALLVR